MLIAAVLAMLVAASVLFHFLNPWQATPIASNWGSIDTTLAISFLVCGIFFVAVMVFLIHCLIKYRHKEGRRAYYEPENKKLELWLIITTSVGICAMLAPGLIVYGDFVTPPKDARQVEVLGQQWRWSYRFPGNDGALGTTAVSHISLENPFGINPNDPKGQDDVLVQSAELHLPIDQPTVFLLRSTDVLHNFYVPHFRAKMDLIPGIITSFWATPTKKGRYEALCAELCGVGHYNMRGSVVVENRITFENWLNLQPTFAETLSGGNAKGLAEQGQQLSQNMGCTACHSVDGSKSLGPGWKNMYGRTETLQDGSTVLIDDDYIAESIRAPNEKLVKGYPPVMVAYDISEEQMAAMTTFIQSLSSTESAETGN